MKKFLFGVILPAFCAVSLIPAAAQPEGPDLQLQVLKYKNNRLTFRLGTSCESLYPGKTVTLYLNSKKVISIEIGEGGESGMGLSDEKDIYVPSLSVLEIRTDAGTFIFELKPADLKSRAKDYDWINGVLKK